VRALDAVVPLLGYVQYDVGDPSSGGRLAMLSSGQDCDAYPSRVTSFEVESAGLTPSSTDLLQLGHG